MRRGVGQITAQIARWGFAVLVAIAGAIGILVAATVAIPADMPAVALRAAAVYRLEVGGAIFVGFYLASLAFVLALHNRGFTEIGTDGIKARNLDKMSEAMLAQGGSVKLLFEIVDELRGLRDEKAEDRDGG